MLAAPLGWVGGSLYYAHLLEQHGNPQVTQENYKDYPEIQNPVTQIIVDLEVIAPWLLVIAVLMYWFKLAITRNLSYCVIGAFAICLLLREIHWDQTIKTIIFPLLGAVMIWMYFWRDLMDKPSQNKVHTVFFIAAIFTYFCCQVVEKRLLRPLPYEFATHTLLEEISETIAHSLLILAALLGSWKRRTLNYK